MDEATLEGCFAKVDRAEVLLDCYAGEWSAFLKTNPYPSRVEVERQSGWHFIYFNLSTPSPPSIPVIAGEIAHDLRSALDHLAWREATECVGAPSAEQSARHIMFPLAENSAEFKASQTLQYVGKDARALMERHQPYKRGKGKGPKSLGLLHWFNRMDKHRTLHTAATSVLPFLGWPTELIDFNPDARLLDFSMDTQPFRRLKRETEIARFCFDPAGPDPQVRVKRTPDLAVGFRQIPRPLRGITLPETVQEVRGVVTDFADLLP